MKDIQRYDVQIFEDIKHINEYGQEFWYARELQPVLEYSEWRNFEKVISKAKIACKNAGGIENNDFVGVNKIIEAGFANKLVSDYMLSRYACYLIAGEVKKPERTSGFPDIHQKRFLPEPLTEF